MELYNGQLKEYNFNIERKKGKYKDGTTSKVRCFDIFTFDLENTNGWIKDGEVIPYEKGHNDEYWKELEPVSLVYCWAFSVNDRVFYGRDIVDFLQVLDDLPDAELQIFIHNLSHEFCFFANILTPENVFARSPHKPMKCTYKEYPKYTFRCSYIMTNLSLANWGKQIGFYKKEGQLDYDAKIRTPLSELDPNELEYQEYDCLVVYHGILKELEQYKTVFDIPLTSTGKVRKIVKSRLFADDDYSYWIKGLVPTYEEYKMLLQAFQGGYCHCNKIHCGKIIDRDYMSMFGDLINESVISHWDFSSSYPTVLLSEKYAFSRFYKREKKYIVTNPEQRDKYAFIYKLRFTELRSKNPNSYISFSKSIINGTCTKDNGRVINCYGSLIYTCTDADLDIINWLYDYDKVEVLESWYARKEYLPRNFLNYVLELYSDKTTLKGIEEQKDFYMLQKGRLNSLYGMCVTALIPDDCIQDGDNWLVSIPSEEEIRKKLQELGDRRKSYKQDYFLGFSWGVFCTAYSRKNLFKCALGIDDNGNKHEGTQNGWNCLYFDTDSIFTMGRPDYSWYNEEILAKLKRCCEERRLDFSKIEPVDIDGVKRPLGVFDAEPDIKEFKCLHAKSYLERRMNDKLYMTVAGINKGSVELLNNSMDNFTDGFYFDKDAECVKKLLPTYCNSQPKLIYPDGYVSHYKYGKNLRATGYRLSQTEEYKQLLECYEMSFEDFDESQITAFRKDIV